MNQYATIKYLRNEALNMREEMKHEKAKFLALRFSYGLRTVIGREHFNEMRSENAKEQNKSICHSHDYCDANQVMLDAFLDAFGREVNLQADPDTELINAAWDIAKDKYLTGE